MSVSRGPGSIGIILFILSGLSLSLIVGSIKSKDPISSIKRQVILVSGREMKQILHRRLSLAISCYLCELLCLKFHSFIIIIIIIICPLEAEVISSNLIRFRVFQKLRKNLALVLERLFSCQTHPRTNYFTLSHYTTSRRLEGQVLLSFPFFSRQV